MRFASQILALFLAITTFATPCLAKIQTGHKPATTGIVSTEFDNDKCNGPCLIAIIARPDQDLPAVTQTSGNDVIAASVHLHQPFLPNRKQLSLFKPPEPSCLHQVNLFFLCRQLN